MINDIVGVFAGTKDQPTVTPNVYRLASASPETLASASVPAGRSEYAATQRDTYGAVFDYQSQFASGQIPVFLGGWDKIPADPSLIELANTHGMLLQDLLEVMDPSCEYAAESNPLHGTTAIDRQLIRFGWMPRAQRSVYKPHDDFRLSAAVSNTPANALYFPAMVKSVLFWEPILNQDLDPARLLAGTRSQKEKTFLQLQVDDSEMIHRRYSEVAEMAEVPTATLRVSGYSGTMMKHGVGLAYSREFAEQTSFNVFATALQRLAIHERIALFEHVLDTALNGNRRYGMTAGATATMAKTYDAMITSAGEISFIAQILHLNAMRPYRPLVVGNVNTYFSFVQAIPPANVIDNFVLQTLVAANYPNMPNLIPTDLFGQTPQYLSVPNSIMADNYLLYIDPSQALGRVIMAGSEWSDMIYDGQKQAYKQTFTIYDGLEALPAFSTACQVLLLEVV